MLAQLSPTLETCEAPCLNGFPVDQQSKIRAETVLGVHQLPNEPCGVAPEKYVAEIDRMLKQRYSTGATRISK
jgi:hypothetical protein